MVKPIQEDVQTAWGYAIKYPDNEFYLTHFMGTLRRSGLSVEEAGFSDQAVKDYYLARIQTLWAKVRLWPEDSTKVNRLGNCMNDMGITLAEAGIDEKEWLRHSILRYEDAVRICKGILADIEEHNVSESTMQEELQDAEQALAQDRKRLAELEDA